MALPLAFNGNQITVRAERISLTDMWRAAGADPQQAPAKWRTLPSTKAFVEHVELTIGKSDSELFVVKIGGKVKGTWAHWQVALAYAKYLSPEFHAWCNTVVRERMERLSKPAPQTGLDAETRAVIGGIFKGIVHKELVVMLPAMLQAELAGDRNRLVIDNMTVGEILDKEGVASKGRRGLVNRCSRALAKFSAGEGLVPRRTHPGRSGVCVYPPEMVQRWLGAAGRALIAAHRADRPNATHDMFASYSATQVKP